MTSSSRKMLQAAAGVGGDFYPYTVDYSARFDGASRMSRTVSAGNRKTWTLSVWVKKTVPIQGTTYDSSILSSYSDGNNVADISIDADDNVHWEDYASGYRYFLIPSAKLRDPSAWYHIVFRFDTTQATASDRARIYINGVQQTSFLSGYETYPSQNLDGYINYSSYTHYLGDVGAGYRYFNGYMADFNFIDGQSLDPTSFGQFKNGVWIPKDSSGLTFGTNGFLLDFSNSGALGTDVSGNGNNFTSSGLTSSDQMLDTPTNNFATLNPLLVTASAANTYADGNLQVTTGTTGGGNPTATMPIPSEGKWYFEFTPSSIGPGILVGLWDPDAAEDFGYQTARSIAYLNVNGEKYLDGANTAYGSTWTTSDVIGVAVDAGAGTVTFYKNNVSQGSISYDASGLFPWFSDGSGGSGSTAAFNFGQLGFTYTPPTGALALCTANLPEPTIGPNSATTSDENFNTVLYTGTGSARTVTGVGFQPDWLWIKKRSAAENHALYDVLRGPTKRLESNNTNVEDAETGGVSSFDSDGFSISGASDRSNTSGATYVAWNWKANGSGVTNTDGSITSTVSANTNAGISIVTWTATGSNPSTIGHGLGQTPAMYIVKVRNTASGDWLVYHHKNTSAPETEYLQLSSTAATTDYPVWADTAPTSSVFTLGTYSQNVNGNTFVAYCFAEIEGFSSFGSYTGNGSTDGPFIYCGFRPAFILFKASSTTSHWTIRDSAREPYNTTTDLLYPNLSDAEYTAGPAVDILSNGFKCREGGGTNNDNGVTYIYMAFSEMPFRYSSAR